MPKNKTEWSKIITYFIFFIFAAYWLLFQIFLSQNPSHHHQIYTFSTLYGLMALWGAFCGIKISMKWGGFKSVIGRALLMFSFGLLAQEFGQLSYSYSYIILHLQSADYPSIGDIGFFGSIPFYSLGVIYLSKASGVFSRFKSLIHILPAITIAFVMLILGYFLFLQGYEFDWSNPIRVFLDFGYPLGEAIYISLAASAFILSSGVLGGIMRNRILFILFALCVQFVADYTFLYQTSRGIWVDSGINDFMYFLAYFVMTLGLIQFKTAIDKIKDVTAK